MAGNNGGFNLFPTGSIKPGESIVVSDPEVVESPQDAGGEQGGDLGPAAVVAQRMVAEVVEVSDPLAETAPESDQPAERFDTRDATAADIPAMVEIDLAGFRRVYASRGMTDDELRAELAAMFEARLRILGGELMPVVTQRSASGDEEVIGFTHLLRTKKGPQDFVSWEDTTANGWLTDCHDPLGQNMYVITLSMSPAVAREDAPSLLAARARGLMVANGCELIYSESRMPGLRKWVEHWCRENSRAFETLREEDTARLANQYFGLTRYDVDTGMVLPRDPMLAFCVQLGNMPQRLVPNAYRDEQSMNYGVVCVMPNPIPLSERTDDRVAAVSARFLQASHSLEQANALLAGELERNE